MTKYGKRLTFHQAAAYLDLPESRLRRLVREERITFLRSDGRTLTRQRRDGAGRETYVKSGRVEFLQADLDAYLESQRVIAKADRALPAKSGRGGRAVDRAMAALLPRERDF